MKFFRFLLGLVVGAAVGWTLGTLFAPQSGEDIQRTARERVQQVISEGRRAAEQRMAELDAEFKEAKAPRVAGKAS